MVYCYTQSSVVSLSVCLLDTLVNHTKMTKQIEKPLGIVGFWLIATTVELDQLMLLLIVDRQR